MVTSKGCTLSVNRVQLFDEVKLVGAFYLETYSTRFSSSREPYVEYTKIDSYKDSLYVFVYIMNYETFQ